MFQEDFLLDLDGGPWLMKKAERNGYLKAMIMKYTLVCSIAIFSGGVKLEFRFSGDLYSCLRFSH